LTPHAHVRVLLTFCRHTAYRLTFTHLLLSSHTLPSIHGLRITVCVARLCRLIFCGCLRTRAVRFTTHRRVRAVARSHFGFDVTPARFCTRGYCFGLRIPALVHAALQLIPPHFFLPRAVCRTVLLRLNTVHRTTTVTVPGLVRLVCLTPFYSYRLRWTRILHCSY